MLVLLLLLISRLIKRSGLRISHSKVFSSELKIVKKIVNFLIIILQIFCDSVHQYLQNVEFDRNSIYTNFCFSVLKILREKKFLGFCFGAIGGILE